VRLRTLTPALAMVAALAVLGACRDGGPGRAGSPTAGPSGSPSPSAQATAGDPTGAEVTPPPLTPGTGEGPEPEGRLVFLSFRDGDREIYSVNVDGSDAKNLTNDPGVDENPDVSPDGSQIVWTSDREGETLHLFVMEIDGSNVRQLTEEPGGENSPRWSRDGKRIAYSQGSNVYVIDAEGGEPELVMEGENQATAAPCRAGGFPGGWSPDDRRITYYSASVSRSIGQVCTVDVETGEIEVIVGEPPVYNVEPAWSGDGRYLAFRSIRGGNHDVYTYDFETKVVRRLTDFKGLDVEPGWSPDGEWIAFPSARDNAFLDIYIMRKDGSDVRRVTDHPAKDSEPVWVP
jgi:Tol biopolymer transport system component